VLLWLVYAGWGDDWTTRGAIFRMIYLALALSLGVLLQHVAPLRKRNTHFRCQLDGWLKLMIIHHDGIPAQNNVKKAAVSLTVPYPPIPFTP